MYQSQIRFIIQINLNKFYQHFQSNNLLLYYNIISQVPKLCAFAYYYNLDTYYLTNFICKEKTLLDIITEMFEK